MLSQEGSLGAMEAKAGEAVGDGHSNALAWPRSTRPPSRREPISGRRGDPASGGTAVQRMTRGRLHLQDSMGADDTLRGEAGTGDLKAWHKLNGLRAIRVGLFHFVSCF